MSTIDALLKATMNARSGAGLVVTLVEPDGSERRFAFATTERAASFRRRAVEAGRTVR